jgi:hypothetical protein
MITKEVTNLTYPQIGDATSHHLPARDTVEQASPWERLALGSGIVAAGLVLSAAALFISFIVPQMPPLDAPAAQAAQFYAKMSQSAIYRLVSYLGEAQMPFLILFFSGLFGVLRRAEGSSGPLAVAVMAAGMTLAIIAPLAIMIEDNLLLNAAAAGADPLVVRSFDGLGPLAFALSGFPQAIVLAGTAALILSRQLAPRWIGWLGFILAGLSLIGTGTLEIHALFPVAALAMLLFRLWVLALSIALLRSSQTAG